MAARRNIKIYSGSLYCTFQFRDQIIFETRLPIISKRVFIIFITILIVVGLIFSVNSLDYGTRSVPLDKQLSALQKLLTQNQRLLQNVEKSQLSLLQARYGKRVKLETSYKTSESNSGSGLGGDGILNTRLLPLAYHQQVRSGYALGQNNIEFALLYDIYLISYPHGWPLGGEAQIVNSRYGYRKAPLGRERGQLKFHKGIDLKAGKGVPVLAMAAGTVHVARDSLYGYGRQIRIVHNSGFETLYAHLSHINVRENDYVLPGATIGFVGSTGYSTGPHLHLEVRLNGKHINPGPFLEKD